MNNGRDRRDGISTRLWQRLDKSLRLCEARSG
jgi:hypothetical protein